MDYKCRVQKPTGEIFTKVIDAESKERAREMLLEEKLILLKIEKKNQSFYFVRQNVRLIDMIFFFNNMEMLLGTGIPITEAITVVEDQTKNKYFKTVLQKINKDLNNGESLSDTLKKEKGFPPLVSAVIKVGENTGRLKDNFKMLHDYYLRKLKNKRKIVSALIYPVITLLVACIAIYVISTTVLPKILNSGIIGQTDVGISTKVLMVISDTFTKYKLMPFAVLGIIFLILNRLGNTTFKKERDMLLIKMPIIGSFIKSQNMVQFSTTLSVLMASGVSIIDAIDIIKDLFSNDVYIEELEQAKEAVMQGKTLSSSVSPKLFDKVVISVINIGETTGKMEEALDNLSEYLNDDLDTNIRRLTELVTPVSTILVGGIIALIALGVLKPMFSMYSNLSNI
ncbi:MAG: type II secretion system F family protein [Clostridia bacterium]|jgi:type IV pilus assembly protein PilC|nr:type II secretion system F family protein [Clostridia bacterium]